MAKRKTNRVRVEPSSGNVFSDLGFPDAAKLDTKARRLAARRKYPRAATHRDGSACPEGTRTIPRAFKPCCPEFGSHTLTCYHDVRYEWWPKQGGWFTVIAPSAGGGGIAISFCPHCGSRLTKGKASAQSGRRRHAPLAKVLATMPNVGEDSDFVREQPRRANRVSQLRKTMRRS